MPIFQLYLYNEEQSRQIDATNTVAYYFSEFTTRKRRIPGRRVSNRNANERAENAQDEVEAEGLETLDQVW